MAYGIYSEDFLAICLFMVNGNMSASLLDLIETAELFQKKKITVITEQLTLISGTACSTCA